MADLGGWDSDQTETEELPARRYETLDEFVGDFLVSALWIDLTGQARIWCPELGRHSGAILRLDALHRAFEALRQDPGTGMSTWILHHADPHMAALTSPQGVFKCCNIDRGHDANRERSIPIVPRPRVSSRPKTDVQTVLGHAGHGLPGAPISLQNIRRS